MWYSRPRLWSRKPHAVIPSRGGWPHLAGTEVMLKKEEVTLDTRATNAFGQTTFKGIMAADLAKLSFEIMPKKNGD